MVLWVFGYGSLIWKPDFSYEECVVGYVKNYRRTFYQGCIDFRGTKANPGRTLTMEELEGGVIWGLAFRVTDTVEAYLNERERTYDTRKLLDVYTAESPDVPVVRDALTYIATPCTSNKWYLGPAPLEVVGKHIAWSRGPAGENHEYLFQLEQALERIGCVDKDIVELADAVRLVLTGGALQKSRQLYGTGNGYSWRQCASKVSNEKRVMIRRVWVSFTGALERMALGFEMGGKRHERILGSFLCLLISNDFPLPQSLIMGSDSFKVAHRIEAVRQQMYAGKETSLSPVFFGLEESLRRIREVDSEIVDLAHEVCQILLGQAFQKIAEKLEEMGKATMLAV